MALAARTSVLRKAAVARPARLVAVPARRPVRVVRSSTSEDPSVKLQQQFNDATRFLQEKWEQTSDAEKPAAIAIIIGATIAQIAIGASIDAIHKIPLIHQFLELIGLAVTAVYGYRYFTDPAERDNVRKTIDNFVGGVTGDK